MLVKYKLSDREFASGPISIQQKMGQYERGVHFGAVSLKRCEESRKYPVAVFCLTFFLHYF